MCIKDTMGEEVGKCVFRKYICIYIYIKKCILKLWWHLREASGGGGGGVVVVCFSQKRLLVELSCKLRLQWCGKSGDLLPSGGGELPQNHIGVSKKKTIFWGPNGWGWEGGREKRIEEAEAEKTRYPNSPVLLDDSKKTALSERERVKVVRRTLSSETDDLQDNLK